MTRLKREPIIRKVSGNESIVEFPKLEITIENKIYDISDLSTLENIHEIVMTLKIYLKSQRSYRSVFLEIRNFLKDILKYNKKIDEQSIIKYKLFLDTNAVLSLSSKQQKFSRASLFVELLIRENIIEDFPIPSNFSNIVKEQKKSFSEIARHYIDDDNFDKVDIENIMNQFSLEHLQAKSLSYSVGALDIIHKKAIDDIYRWEKDWTKVEKIIKKLNRKNLDELVSKTDFNKDFPLRERSLKEAFQILYSKFGSDLPAAKYWPAGMVDFFRAKKWKIDRVKSLFEGISINIHDVSILNEAIVNFSSDQKEKFNKIKDYYHDSDGRDPRSIELALSILYANFGRILPDSTQWPTGITDYLKYRNWIPNRVRGAFFPTPETITPFIIGLLSHIEIAPNVDCVAFYTYLTSFKPSSIEGKTNVYMDKFRSKKPLIKDINTTDPMISLCVKHSKRMLFVLKNLGTNEATTIISQKKVPLFLQYTAIGGSIRTLDPTTVTHIVKYFLADLAKEYPCILPLVQNRCSGQNFRPTIVLVKKMFGDSTVTIQKLLNHSHSSTTKVYTERALTQSMILSKSKKFQEYLVENSRNNHSIDKEKLLNTEESNAVDEWISCKAKRIWFKDNDVIADWIAWEKIISKSENELKFDNPIRWEKYWLPRLIKYQNLLANVLEVDLKSAAKIAEIIKLPPLS